jgi:hypothetical protein
MKWPPKLTHSGVARDRCCRHLPACGSRIEASGDFAHLHHALHRPDDSHRDLDVHRQPRHPDGQVRHACPDHRSRGRAKGRARRPAFVLKGAGAYAGLHGTGKIHATLDSSSGDHGCLHGQGAPQRRLGGTRGVSRRGAPRRSPSTVKAHIGRKRRMKTPQAA